MEINVRHRHSKIKHQKNGIMQSYGVCRMESRYLKKNHDILVNILQLLVFQCPVGCYEAVSF